MDAKANFMTKYDKVVRLMNMKVETVTPDFARVSMPLTDELKNGMGYAHGGVIFALADVAFGAASNANRKYGVVNMFSAIEFLRPGAVSPLVAEAKAVRIGGHIASYDVQIYDGSGAVIARTMINGYITNVPIPA